MPDIRKPDSLTPDDHREAVALFRAEIVGALARRDFTHGELRAELEALAQKRYRAPDADDSLAPTSRDTVVDVALGDRVAQRGCGART